MKNTAAFLMALGLALPATMYAQDGDEPRAPRRDRPALRDGVPGQPGRPLERDLDQSEGRRPMPPLVAALDGNHDGVIDEEEIKNSAEALRKLDKNGDGKLTLDELRPERNGPPTDEARPQRRSPRPPAAP